MGVILAALATIILSALARLLADEFKAFRPTIVEALLLRAIRKLPAEMQDRYSEEWRSHLDELPGDLSKVITAIGYNFVHLQLLYDRVGVITSTSRRFADISLAVAALALLLPLLALIAALVWAVDRKPPLVRIIRYDKNGRPYRIIKFRSMFVDGDKILELYLRSNSGARSEWLATQSLEHDPRITRIGHILRKTRLDELPILWDILRGRVIYPWSEIIFLSKIIVWYGMIKRIVKRIRR